MLWPKGEAELKLRVVAAVVLVLAGKAAVLVMPFAYKAVIDNMSSHAAPFGLVAGLVAGYATARFAGVLSDNLRNALFEKVGQNAARRLNEAPAPPPPSLPRVIAPRRTRKRQAN